MGIERRMPTKRKRVLEAEHPDLVRITPTAERLMNIIETDLNPEGFTFNELRSYCVDGGESPLEYDSFGLDDLRLRVALRKLMEAGFIERKSGKRVGWRMTEAASIELHADIQDMIPFEDRD